MKFLIAVCICCAAMTVLAKPSLKELIMANTEQMVMLPSNAVYEAAGFFGPVTKKYLPTFKKFSAEYRVATNKLSVIEKYLPEAKAAYAEAKAMKISEKHAEKKDEYLRMFDRFFTAADAAVAVFGSKVAKQKGISDAK